MKRLGGSSHSPPRLDLRERQLPWAPFSIPCAWARTRACGRVRSFRCRRCLLKGCERIYRPSHPQSRYCSAACRQAARRWRRRQASRTWRASERGKVRRREQCSALSATDSLGRSGRIDARPARSRRPFRFRDPLRAREGQRPATIPEDFSVRPCERPGCYERVRRLLGVVAAAFLLWRLPPGFTHVLDREARYRQRRRAGYRPPSSSSRPAPPRPS